MCLIFLFMESELSIRLNCRTSKCASSNKKLIFKNHIPMKTIKSILTMSLLIISSVLFSQSAGVIKGSVFDEKSSPMPFVPVAIMQDTTIITTAQTDINGEFTVKEITPGKYNIKTFYSGYNIQLLKAVNVNPNQTRYVTINMSLSTTGLPTIVITATFTEPAFDSKFSTVTPISIAQIENIAVGKTDLVGMIVSLTPGVLQTDDGKDLYVRGSRRGSTAYYVDGNKTMGVPDVPGMGISGMEVLTGGVPAEYGDCTGGLVIITTKEYKWEMNRKQNEINDRKERRAAEQEIKPNQEDEDVH